MAKSVANGVLMKVRVESNYAYNEGAERYIDTPVRVSAVMPEGASSPGDVLAVRDDAGKAVVAAIRPFCHWPNGSVRAWDVRFAANLSKRTSRVYEIVKTGSSKPRRSAPANGVRLSDVTLSVWFEDGALARVTIPVPTHDSADGYFRGESPIEIRRAAEYLAFRGALIAERHAWSPCVELSIRLIQHSPHDTLRIRGVRLEFDVASANLGGNVRYCVMQTAYTASHPRWPEMAMPIPVVADASGVHATDLQHLGDVDTNYPPYERGVYLNSVAPWMGVVGDKGGYLLAVIEAAERFPKAWQCAGNRVTLDLHPRESDPLAWRQGMAMFQRFVVTDTPARATSKDCEEIAIRILRPPFASIDADVYRAAGWRIPFRFDPARYPRTEITIRDNFHFYWSRGTFDYGDMLQGGSKKARNLEYDFPAVACKEWARTGGAHLWDQLRASAEHMMYTDFVDVNNDPWREGGIPAHCKDHTSGSAYPSHMWAEGLTLWHLISGDPYAITVAMRVGDFYLKYIDQRFNVVFATAREVGWTLIALSAIYDVTRESRYLDGIKRVVDHLLAMPINDYLPEDSCFTLALTIIGIDRVRPFHRDKDIQKFMVALMDRINRLRYDPTGLYKYWQESRIGTLPIIQSYVPEALTLCYRLTNNEDYLRRAWRLWQIALGGLAITVQDKFGPPECGYAAGFNITWQGAFQAFAEKGWLDAVQYAEPPG